MTRGRCAVCDTPIVWAVWQRSLIRAAFDQEQVLGGRVELLAVNGSTWARMVRPHPQRPRYVPHDLDHNPREDR